MSTKEDDPKDWLYARNLLRKIIREWMGSLSASEFCLVMFVYDRTIGWGKTWEKITLKQVTTGIVSASGECYASPVTRNRNHAVALMAEAKRRGWLLSRPNERRKLAVDYALNPHWSPENYVKIPKRLREKAANGGEISEKGYKSDTVHGYKSDTEKGYKSDTAKRYTIKGQKGIVRSDAPHAMGVEAEPEPEPHLMSALAAIGDMAARSKARRAEKKAKGRTLRSDGTGFVPTVSALTTTLEDLYRAHCANQPIPAVTAVTIRILRQYAEAWTLARGEGEFLHYLTFLFEFWNTLRKNQFSWMKDCPTVPDLSLVANSKLRPKFEDAYNQRTEVERMARMGVAERRAYRKQVHMGQHVDAEERAPEAKPTKTKRTTDATVKAFRNRAGARVTMRERSPLRDSEGEFGKWKD